MLKPSSLGGSVVVEFGGGLLAFDFFFAAMVNGNDGKHCELVVDDSAYVTVILSTSVDPPSLLQSRRTINKA